MPTAAEVALQKRYADMRAKQQQQVTHTGHIRCSKRPRLLRI